MYRSEREQLEAERASLTERLIEAREAAVAAELELEVTRRHLRALRSAVLRRYLELAFGWAVSSRPWMPAPRERPPLRRPPPETASIEALRAHNVGLRAELESAERRSAALGSAQQELGRELRRLRASAQRRAVAASPDPPGRSWVRALWRWGLLVPMFLTTKVIVEEPMGPLPSWRDDAAWEAWWVEHRATMRWIWLFILCLLVLPCVYGFLEHKYDIDLGE